MTPLGITLVETLCALLVLFVLAAIILPAVGPRRRGGCSRQLKDQTQIRGITQSLIVWAQNNNGHYPLPGELDKDDLTVAGAPDTKNTTANILSLMIFNGNISPEIIISPAESNTGRVRLMDDYAYQTPKAAVNPEKALWDPRFRGTADDAPRAITDPISAPGNNSYAHALPIGARREEFWRDSFATNEVIFGNRGPSYAANDAATGREKWALLAGALGTSSYTLLIHGGRTTWEGNIGYNDGHVNFETKPTPEGLTYTRAGDAKNPKGRAIADNLFVNESDEVDGDAPGSFSKGLNAFLRPIARMTTPTAPVFWRD